MDGHIDIHAFTSIIIDDISLKNNYVSIGYTVTLARLVKLHTPPCFILEDLVSKSYKCLTTGLRFLAEVNKSRILITG